jgi:predicted GNAT family N-acyltransferase
LSTGHSLAVTVREARGPAERRAAMALRTVVFCDEQGVSGPDEFDGLDEEAIQVVALDRGRVVATCRLRLLDGGRDCKLERMAVERPLRGAGVGAGLLAGAELIARERGAEHMLLHAQIPARGFYAGSGYDAEGALFLEAGIEHVRMTKPLERPGRA